MVEIHVVRDTGHWTALKLILYIAIQLRRYDYNRRYHDAFDYDRSGRNYDMRSIRVHFFARVELEAGARDTS